EILRDEALPITYGYRVRVHAAFVQGEGVGCDDDRLAEALSGRKPVGAFKKICETLGKGVVAATVAMKQIDDGIMAGRVASIARRQINGHFAIGRIPLEIALEPLTVDDDGFDGPGFGLCRRPASTAPLGASPGPAGHQENPGERDGREVLDDHRGDFSKVKSAKLKSGK